MPQFKGVSEKHEIKPSRRRKDTRRFGQKLSHFLNSGDGAVLVVICFPIVAILSAKVPFSGEILLFIAWVFKKYYIEMKNRSFDLPYRVPIHAKVRDGSTRRGQELGGGITLLGNDVETKEQIWAGNSDLRTHMLVLGTTGSGKTEFLLGLVFNALVQNTGFIYVDGKGDPKLQKEIFRLARFLGREDDLLIINFITSGRDFIEKQVDKVTNNMNIMGNTSSGMLIELIVSLMDDSGGGGDMWKGRAISFVASLTRPLTYLRDKGYINLSPEKYLEYFELNIIEELVWEHNGKYGEAFDVIVAPLRSYLTTLPGYQKTKKKQQEQKTLEQHGYIVMQLTRIFNDLNFNYGHIFKTKVGDVDFFDVVINRRLLTVLLPALERAPDSLRMLGKMIVGSIKQMMAGCLGNRVEGAVREIIDSRPTNASFPFYTILDEYGYYAVIGFAVAPAQARSLGFSVIFAAQDFSSLKKSSAEEADATWENTNVRAVGRITSGQKSETWERLVGASGEADEARSAGYVKKMGITDETYYQQDNVNVESKARLNYDDLAGQENGEFTFLIGKKKNKGQVGGVRVIRGMSFYTAGANPKEMRINDFLPVESPEPSDLPQNRKAVEALVRSLLDGSFTKTVRSVIKNDGLLTSMHNGFERNYADPERPALNRMDVSFAMLAWYLEDNRKISPVLANVPDTVNEVSQSVAAQLEDTAIVSAMLSIADSLADNESLPVEVLPAEIHDTDNDEDVVISSRSVMTTNVIMTLDDSDAFKERALPILRQHLYMIDALPSDDDWESELSVADKAQLLELEVLASNRSFESMEEKFEAEERIEKMRAEMARETDYIAPPLPKPADIEELKENLSLLSERCLGYVKDILNKQGE